MVYRTVWRLDSLALLCGLVLVWLPNSQTSKEIVTNEWHVHMNDDVGIDVAKRVAMRTGFTLLAPVGTKLCFGSVQIITRNGQYGVTKLMDGAFQPNSIRIVISPENHQEYRSITYSFRHRFIFH
jgi:hypothetical protein